MAAARGLTPRELPVADLQAELLRSGALGPREQPKLPEPRAEGDLHESSWMPPQPPALPVAQWAERLGGEGSAEATWELIRSGDEALPLLLAAAEADQPARRFWASTALAMLRRPEAAPELRAAVAERRADVPEGRKTAPQWHGAMVLLGRIGDRDAVPELCSVLDDPETPLDALIAAVRALGRIGDPAAVPALEAAVARDDLPTERVLQNSGAASINPVVEDARWQIDLAAAEALARLGAPRPDLAERHLADERALVRRYAERVAELIEDVEG
jgi:HEAT repeat protein